MTKRQILRRVALVLLPVALLVTMIAHVGDVTFWHGFVVGAAGMLWFDFFTDLYHADL